MNPSTGTFTSMDTYQGSTFVPITLHKYLYADANPVMNCDPSGYMSIGEMSATMGGMSALSGMLITGLALIEFMSFAVTGQSTFSNITIFLLERMEDIANGSLTSSLIKDMLKDLTRAAAIGSALAKRLAGDNTVYYVEEEGTIIYVGRTNDLVEREKAHRRKSERSNWNLTAVATGLSKEAAMVLEQALISSFSFKNGTLVNKRREIAPGNIGLPKYKPAIDVIRAQMGVAEDELYEALRGN